MPFKSKISPSIGLVASPTTVSDTVSAGLAHTIIGLSCANTGLNDINVSIKLNKSGGTSAFLVKDCKVYATVALVVVGMEQKLVLEPGDTVTAYTDTASSCDVVLSYLSVTNT